MKLTKVLMAVAIIATLGFVSCKPKDADIKAKIEAALKASPDMASTMVDVKDGVVTLTGECKDETCKANCGKAVEDLKVKGVKNVVNSCGVKPAVMEPASTTVNVSIDAAVQQKINDGLKDIKGATVSFEGKKAIFSGTLSASQKTTLQQLCGSAGVAADMSKATIK